MRAQRGSAISETLVGLLVLLPAFWVVDWLGRLHDVQRSAVASARYLAWEETIEYGNRAHSELIVRDRIAGNDHAGIRRAADIRKQPPPINPLWQRTSESDQPLVSSEGFESERTASETLASHGYAVAAVAHGDGVPAAARLGGLSGQMLGQPPERLRQQRYRINVASLDEVTPPDQAVVFEETAALTTGDWRATTDREYQRRTEDLVASEPVHWVSQPAQQLGRFFVFKEGRYASSTDFVPPSHLAPH